MPDKNDNLHIGSSLDDFLREDLGDEAYERMTDRVKARVAQLVAKQHDEASQRRANLVTLTAAALTSLACKYGRESGWQGNVAWEAVSLAEAALAEIERSASK